MRVCVSEFVTYTEEAKEYRDMNKEVEEEEDIHNYT